MKLKSLNNVGLGYLKLGQSLSTLSGGECQRIKFADELCKSGNVYILDEPTTGLHMADTEILSQLLNRLVESGNTVIVIEHNLNLVKQADWIIDMGNKAGDFGGTILFEGIPSDLLMVENSVTADFLKRDRPGLI